MGLLRNQSLALPTFIMTGIPGVGVRNIGVSIPFCSLYVVAILGNGAVLLAIAMDRSLHKPMYLFLAMLAASELGVSVSTLPTVLAVFLFDARKISIDACFAQMFFIHSFSLMDSGVLWAMALDRFIAIYKPLQYTTILTSYRIAMIGSGIALRSTILLIPVMLLLRKLPFCKSTVLAHPYCLHPNLIRLPCADTTVNSLYGLAVVILTFGLDALFIVLSYVLILKSVLMMASKEGRLKALNTCMSHICAVIIYYTPMLGVSLVARFGKHASPLVHSLMAHFYLLVPPVVNPIIYSIKTKELLKAICRLLSRKKF